MLGPILGLNPVRAHPLLHLLFLEGESITLKQLRNAALYQLWLQKGPSKLLMEIPLFPLQIPGRYLALVSLLIPTTLQSNQSECPAEQPGQEPYLISPPTCPCAPAGLSAVQAS